MTDEEFTHAMKFIQTRTDSNDHSSAIVDGIDLLQMEGVEGLDGLREKASAIVEEHAMMGELTSDLSTRRRIVYQDMMDIAQRNLSPKRYEAFYAGF